MDKIIERLEVTGEIKIAFKIEESGDATKRGIPDELLYERINKSICECIEDLGIEVLDSKIFNFDIYKERFEG